MASVPPNFPKERTHSSTMEKRLMAALDQHQFQSVQIAGKQACLARDTALEHTASWVKQSQQQLEHADLGRSIRMTCPVDIDNQGSPVNNSNMGKSTLYVENNILKRAEKLHEEAYAKLKPVPKLGKSGFTLRKEREAEEAARIKAMGVSYACACNVGKVV